MNLIWSLVGVVMIAIGALTISQSYSYSVASTRTLNLKQDVEQTLFSTMNRVRLQLDANGGLSQSLSVAAGSPGDYTAAMPDLSSPDVFQVVFGSPQTNSPTIDSLPSTIVFTAKAYRARVNGTATELVAGTDSINFADFVVISGRVNLPQNPTPIIYQSTITVAR